MVKIIILTIAAMHISACGSFRTVAKSNRDIGFDLKQNDSYCQASTRVYSGVTYDFCRFHAKANAGTINMLKSGLFLLDITLLSPVADTLFLPVTIVQQIKFGNPKVKSTSD